jgi:hypothetical protein
VKRITIFAALGFLLGAMAADADELHPPQGFEYAEAKESPKGSFRLVHYIKPPGDFTCESQIWLEPLKPGLKRQELFTFTNRAYPVIDATETHIAIAHHETSGDNLLWLFVRGPGSLFHRVPHELRAAALKEFSRQTGIHKTRDDFDHFDCYPEAWLDKGQLRGYLKGDSHDNHFYLKPWYFIYDADHEKFVPHDFPENKDAFVQEHR